MLRGRPSSALGPEEFVEAFDPEVYKSFESNNLRDTIRKEASPFLTMTHVNRRRIRGQNLPNRCSHRGF
jgi:hypothetical protein